MAMIKGMKWIVKEQKTRKFNIYTAPAIISYWPFKRLVMKTVGHYDNREDALAAMRNWNIKVGNEIDLHPYLERVSPYGYNVTL